MYLKKLSIISFKNIAESTLEFNTRVNCFVGDNGAGKTNILDAIYFLSMCKSAFSMSDGQCVMRGGDFFVIEGEYQSDERSRQRVVVSFKKGANKVIKRDGKEYARISEHIGRVPMVIVSPDDSMLITDSANERRLFLNLVLSQISPSYLSAMMRYNRVLGERNKLLKNTGATDVMEVLDMQLVESGNIVYGQRKELIERLSPLVESYYKKLSDDRETIEVNYSSELLHTPFEELLLQSRQRDQMSQFTTVGVHRDDMKMSINGVSIRRFGSQGQQKSLLLALKLAQYSLLKEEKNEKPILLLDDLFDKLDARRVEALLELVSGEEFGQIFITDCNRESLEGILGGGVEKYNIFEVNGGKAEEK